LTYVFDTGAALLRPVLGVPGSAVPGDPAAFTGPLRDAAVGPRADFVLAVAQDSGRVFIATFAGSGVLDTGAPPSPDRMALSPKASAALLYYAASGEFVIVTGLPSQPAIAADVTSPAAGALTALAVSDDGRSAIAAFDDGTRQSLAVIREGSLSSAAAPGTIAGIRFDTGTRDAILADSANSAIVQLGPASLEVVPIAGSDDGVDHPSAAWREPRTGALLIANANGDIVVVDPGASGQREHHAVPCGCAPQVLEPVGADSIFVLTGAGARLRLFDAIARRVLFVPAPPRDGGNR
jgi:hypothetical protein